MSRVNEVADALRGTTISLGDVITEQEALDTAFLSLLDELVMLCETCGWWCDSDELDDDQNCTDCNEE